MVTVFAGATSGIGEATLKTFVKYAVEPRIYLFARKQAAAERLIAECRQINPRGEYIFIYADLMSIKETDRACEQVKKKEKLVNLVVLSAGQLIFDRNRKSSCLSKARKRKVRKLIRQIATPEGLNVTLAAACYSRFRIAQQLLPLLTAAAATTSIARVVNVAAGTYEGALNTADIQVQNVPIAKAFSKLKPHMASMTTLYLEALAQRAPTVSFVHDFPGAVYTNLHKNAVGTIGLLVRIIFEVVYTLLGRWLFVSIEESGERHVYFATSMRYRPEKGEAVGVVSSDMETAEGSDGVIGSGVYSIDWNGEKRTKSSITALKDLRNKGVRETVWNHVTGEFDRITGRA